MRGVANGVDRVANGVANEVDGVAKLEILN